MQRYESIDQRVLLTGRRLSLENGGYVPRSHLRQAMAGLGADIVDVVLARHRILPQTFATQTRGRPVTVYAFEDFDRACEVEKFQAVAPVSGYAAALQTLQPEDYKRLQLKVLRAALSLSSDVGFVLRVRLKAKFNTIPAEDLSHIMKDSGVEVCQKGHSQAYEKESIERELERLEILTQVTSGTTESSPQDEGSVPALSDSEKTDDPYLKGVEDRAKSKPW